METCDLTPLDVDHDTAYLTLGAVADDPVWCAELLFTWAVTRPRPNAGVECSKVVTNPEPCAVGALAAARSEVGSAVRAFVELLGDATAIADAAVMSAAAFDLDARWEPVLRIAAAITAATPVREHLAGHTDDALILMVLAADPMWWIRGEVAGNEHVPQPALEMLCDDTETQVRAALWASDHVTQDTLDRLASNRVWVD